MFSPHAERWDVTNEQFERIAFHDMARISGDISDTELVHFSTIPNCYRV